MRFLTVPAFVLAAAASVWAAAAASPWWIIAVVLTGAPALVGCHDLLQHRHSACQTNRCPVGVATQDPRRARALDVADKTQRVFRFQQATVAEAQRIIASMGPAGPEELAPSMLFRQVDQATARSYAELYRWLEPGELLAEAPEGWAADWAAADPDAFGVAVPRARASHA
jgi:hypothetical protein